MKKSEQEIRKLITPEMVDSANAFCMAKAFVQTVKPIVEGYEKEILVRYQFTNKGEQDMLKRLQKHKRHLGEVCPERIILDSNQTYLMSDEDSAIYEKERQAACAKSGLKVEAPEYCPLLVAEDLERYARRVFIDSMEPITKISSNRIVMIENIEEMAKLSLGLIASAGLLKNTLK